MNWILRIKHRQWKAERSDSCARSKTFKKIYQQQHILHRASTNLRVGNLIGIITFRTKERKIQTAYTEFIARNDNTITITTTTTTIIITSSSIVAQEIDWNSDWQRRGKLSTVHVFIFLKMNWYLISNGSFYSNLSRKMIEASVSTI